ncbi:hypothetical protein CAPTEDRAFT_56271, partial [Capitella teleta]
PGAFSKYTQLTELRLTESRVRMVAEDAFTGTMISILSLGGNEIEDIPDLSEIASNLIELILANNKIRFIGVSFFREMHKLKELRLDGNQLDQFPDMSELPADNMLKSINIANNLIKNTEINALEGLHRLSNLDFSRNKITRIP